MGSSPSIERLLIANRGEIAVRIAATARRLGLTSVGVYAEPDARAVHVGAVDVAIALGGASPAESYLRGEAIIAAARATGADAVHPGYGFLAENADFADEVIAAGLVWVGPTPDQIRLLGDKVAAKRAAIEAGVPTTSIVEVVEGQAVDATAVHFPALVKAAAGGGGRGMRVVGSAAELHEAIIGASREAAAAFGDGTVFIEPYLARGRHVEVQIFGDAHGNVIHLGERECSIQRRNQKVLEESPSAGIDDATRRTLHDGALALARHVGYQNAGTVEFMVGADGTITFLEVNTRLQVEHPVTEAVTGLDLVELQLIVASGAPLPITQDDVTSSGHAIEVRLVAEDPAAGWLPSTGTLTRFSVPDTVRVDAGVAAGSMVSTDYDSLLAKVIAHEPTRAGATRVLGRALRGTDVGGLRTNVDTLAAILATPAFLAADTTTGFLDEHPAVLEADLAGADRDALLVAAVFAMEYAVRDGDAVTGFAPSGWRNLRTQGQRQVWTDERGNAEHVEYLVDGSSSVHGRATSAVVRLGRWPEPDADGVLAADVRRTAAVRLLERSTDRQAVEIDGRHTTVRTTVDHTPGSDRLLDGGVVHTASPAASRTWRLAPRFVLHDHDVGGAGPVSPLPGTVIAVHVAPGDEVVDGQVLMVVEAMKMEHKITAHGDAVVVEVRFGVGERVDTGDLLVALEIAGASDEGVDDDAADGDGAR